MGRVMIECPVTGKSVVVGYGMPREQVESSTMGNDSVECPTCGHLHIWGKPDAWVED